MEVREHFLQLTTRASAVPHHVRHFGIEQAQLLQCEVLTHNLRHPVFGFAEHLRAIVYTTAPRHNVTEEAPVEMHVIIESVQRAEPDRFAERLLGELEIVGA